jgi:hypothetical protein
MHSLMIWSHPSLLLIVPAAVGALSLALHVYAFRGRRVDDHPVCRKCGFDLIGKPAGVSRCSECGADLARKNAVRDGHRAKRYALMAVAAPALLLCGGALGFVTWASTKDINLNVHKPAWWLVGETGSGSAATRDAAMSELFDRLRAGRLSKTQVRDIAERVLACQADRSRPWNPPWNQFVEQARDDRLLSDDQWETYARQAQVLELEVASTGSGDELLKVIMRSRFRDGGNKRFLVRAWWTDPCVIGGEPGPKGIAAEPFLVQYGDRGGKAAMTVHPPKHLLPQPDAPPRTVQVPVEVEVYEVDYDQVQWINWRTTRPDPKWQRAEFRTTLTATWQLAPPPQVVKSPPTPAAPSAPFPIPGALPKVEVGEAAPAPTVEAAVRVSDVTLRGVETWAPELSVIVEVVRPPENVAFKVVLRTPRAQGPLDQDLGIVTCAADQTVRLVVSRGNVLAPKPGGVDVILKPSARAAAAAFIGVKAWDGELVFKDLPVSVRNKDPERR